jgi:hypothetical protein
MLKYGSLNTIQSINSKTLLPRNLTFQYSLKQNNSSITNTNTTNTFISASITDLNVSTINFNNNLIVSSNNNSFINFDYINSIIEFFYNIYINKINPKITFDSDKTLEISSINSLTKLQITKNNVNIIGSVNSKSLLNISNSGGTYNLGSNFYNFTPISKTYILSGVTNINENISFVFQNILSENTFQYSGKLNITTRNTSNTLINIYNINIWTINGIVEYDSLNKLNINNSGDWNINNITLSNLPEGNITLNCNGSSNYSVIWGIKLDGLSI